MERKLSRILFLLVVLFSCTEENEPFFFSNKGVIKGTVHLDDPFEEPGGTQVVLKGANISQTAITNVTGQYRFENLPTSTYEVHLTRPGFAPLKIFNIKQSGSDTVTVYSGNVTALYRMAEYNPPVITSIIVDESSDGSLFLEMIARAEYYGKARLFLGTTPDVSFLKYKYTELITYNEGKGRIWGYGTYHFRKTWPGVDKLYVVLYSDGGGSYFDPLIGRWIFSALNEKRFSEVKMISLPI